MNTCNQILRHQGKPYPRTCAVCGLGPCHEIVKAQAVKTPPKSGVMLIAEERQRQKDIEGWTAEHDALYVNGELRDAGIAYAMACDDRAGEDAASLWPWEVDLWKPSESPIRNLVKAGALIAAEIDRLQLSISPSGDVATREKQTASTTEPVEIVSQSSLAAFRDIVLNGRGLLAESLDGDQTNAVLHEFDACFGEFSKLTLIPTELWEQASELVSTVLTMSWNEASGDMEKVTVQAQSIEAKIEDLKRLSTTQEA